MELWVSWADASDVGAGAGTLALVGIDSIKPSKSSRDSSNGSSIGADPTAAVPTGREAPDETLPEASTAGCCCAGVCGKRKSLEGGFCGVGTFHDDRSKPSMPSSPNRLASNSKRAWSNSKKPVSWERKPSGFGVWVVGMAELAMRQIRSLSRKTFGDQAHVARAGEQWLRKELLSRTR